LSSPILNLFAKAPQPGQVKTRLQKGCSAAKAAQIARELVICSVELTTQSWPGEVQLQVWPDAGHPFFRWLHGDYAVALFTQVKGDLGAKITATLDDGISRRGAAAVMGCDVPHCPGEVLEQAYFSLTRGKNVIGLCDDGGYYFIGLTVPVPALFQNIPWGSDKVGSTTLAKADALGIEFDTHLPMLRDIDYWEDLEAAAHTCHKLLPLLQC